MVFDWRTPAALDFADILHISVAFMESFIQEEGDASHSSFSRLFAEKSDQFNPQFSSRSADVPIFKDLVVKISVFTAALCNTVGF